METSGSNGHRWTSNSVQTGHVPFKTHWGPYCGPRHSWWWEQMDGQQYCIIVSSHPSCQLTSYISWDVIGFITRTWSWTSKNNDLVFGTPCPSPVCKLLCSTRLCPLLDLSWQILWYDFLFKRSDHTVIQPQVNLTRNHTNLAEVITSTHRTKNSHASRAGNFQGNNQNRTGHRSSALRPFDLLQFPDRLAPFTTLHMPRFFSHFSANECGTKR